MLAISKLKYTKYKTKTKNTKTTPLRIYIYPPGYEVMPYDSLEVLYSYLLCSSRVTRTQ